MSIRVAVIEDDEIFREGLVSCINSFPEFEVVDNFSSSNITNFFTNFKNISKLKLVIICPPSDFDRFEKMLDLISPFYVLILTNTLTKRSLLKAMEIGVAAFYTKKISKSELHKIILELSGNKTFTDIKMNIGVKYDLSKGTLDDVSFTNQEFEVLELVCEQKNSIQIADFLDVSIRTVESRKRSMMRKTNSKNMIGVVVIYINYLNQINL
ncbi:response regulator transcription factor [Crocinitomix catalasitica]|uniref:response regulator transcription factor n=1 Tax=Crocinitomix catalasitica TaxID=184607 RepID=UPI0004887FE7|nr:response regulator transcription factor [Crocinitomix catalasitica]